MVVLQVPSAAAAMGPNGTGGVNALHGKEGSGSVVFRLWRMVRIGIEHGNARTRLGPTCIQDEDSGAVRTRGYRNRSFATDLRSAASRAYAVATGRARRVASKRPTSVTSPTGFVSMVCQSY